MIGYVIAVVVIVLVHHVIKRSLEPGNLPPGPRPYPLIGNLPNILSTASNIHLGLMDIAKKYGNIFTLYLNGQRTVIVSSSQVAREVLVTRNDDMAGRPFSFSADFAFRGGKDIAFNDFCDTLVLQRKIMHTALRLYRPKMEATVCREVDKLLARVKALDGKSFDPYRSISLTVLNVICEIVFGLNFEYDDPEFLEVVRFNEQIALSFGAINILDMMPFLIHFPIQAARRLKESKRDRDVFLEKELDRHMESYDEENIKDLTDASIKALSDAEREDSKSRHLITRDHVLMSLGDMFSAGNETAVTTLRWLFAHLVRNPEIQEKLHAELDEVIGRDLERLPTLADRSKLPYLEASILETLRISAPAPMGVPHKAMVDTTVQGYSIPKDTTVILNVWAIHHNKDDWKHPEIFNPSRFLDDEGNICSSATRNLLPFGAGRRVCIGETDSKIELFLIVARFLHQFRLESPADESLPDMIGHLGIVNFPKPYKICAIRRL
ncbi:hypothetical protein QZH41_002592 [Actinostola sp. cb2023]|nr:hypothetical protein QZH41_002592 [Actinostola sp. cb2023]